MRPTEYILDRVRERFMLRRCKEVEIYETDLYHGSPIEGMEQIRRHGRIAPQEGCGMLYGSWLSVSTNDNMLRHFSDGDGLTGMVFDRRGVSLRCLQLDYMHFALACEACDYVPEWLNQPSGEEERQWAYRLGYNDCRANLAIYQGDFFRMLPDWVDGVIFPWGCDARSGGDEAEIALTERGCERLWPALDQVVVTGEWLDPEAGWRKIKRLARRRAA